MKKLSLFLVSVLAASSLSAQSDYDVSLKYGLTSIDNDDGWNLENHTVAGDISFDLGYALKPRVDLVYVNIDKDDKVGKGVSAFIQGAVSAQYSKEFDMLHFPHEFYLFGGLGYEYVADGHDTLDSLPFFQGGVGVKYGLTDSLNLLAELKGMQVFDGNNDPDDEGNEFTVMVGVNFPFGQGASHKREITLSPAMEVVSQAPIMVAPQTPVMDTDGDGVPDNLDACPKTNYKEGMTIGENGCEVQILLDSDNDGITDDVDACKNTPMGVEVDGSGCAAGAVAGAINLDINFASNSSVIKAESISKVKEFAKQIKALPDGAIVTIEGYTDSSGNEARNKELSSKRAFAVRNALIGAGVAKKMVRAYGKGSSNPIASNETEEGRAENRRIEAVIEQ